MFENARVGDRVWSVTKRWGTVVHHYDEGIYVEFDLGIGCWFKRNGVRRIGEEPELFWDAIDFIPPPPPERWVEKEKWLAPVVHPRSGLIFVTSCGVPEKYDSSYEAIRAQTEYASRADTEFAQYPEPFKLTWYEKEETWK